MQPRDLCPEEEVKWGLKNKGLINDDNEGQDGDLSGAPEEQRWMAVVETCTDWF